VELDGGKQQEVQQRIRGSCGPNSKPLNKAAAAKSDYALKAS
jgi:hypothetical protein